MVLLSSGETIQLDGEGHSFRYQHHSSEAVKHSSIKYLFDTFCFELDILFLCVVLTMCKVYLLSEKTGERSKKLSDELKVENLPHYARPAIHRPFGC